MNRTFLTGLASLFFAGALSVSPVLAAEGDVGTQAYAFTGLSDLATVPTTYSLSQYQGKVVLLVVFQWDCGGCQANAPKIGRLADTLRSGLAGSNFQAIGAEIRTASYAQIQNYRNILTGNGAVAVNFPSVKVPYDTGISGKGVTGDPVDNVGTKWKRYNSYRDVYFVINHLGVITARIAGNRTSAMTTVKYDSLRLALNAALAAVPAAVLPAEARGRNGLKVFPRNGAYQFEFTGLQPPVTLKIQDLQGRIVRTLSTRSGALIWDAKDAAGKPVPFGTYFVRASDGQTAFSQRMNVLP